MNAQVMENAQDAITPVTTKKRVGFKTVLDTIVTWALVLFVSSYFLSVHIIPMMMGGNSMTVLSGSMSPNLPVGQMIVSVPVDPNTLEVGDVVSYHPTQMNPGGLTTTHRVMSLTKIEGQVTEIIVKGDANPVADKPVNPAQIKGKMIYTVPFVGNFSMFIHGNGSAPAAKW